MSFILYNKCNRIFILQGILQYFLFVFVNMIIIKMVNNKCINNL